MVRAKYKDLERNKPPPEPTSWAEADPVMNRQPGWHINSNREYIAELRKRRTVNKKTKKNSGQQCDHCALDDHDRCWRVVCYCPCYSMRERGDAWPARKIEL